MRRFGIDPRAVDAVILSHLHGDHFGGVPFLILHGQFTGRERPLVVVGPPGVEVRVREAMEVFFPGSSQIERRFDVRYAELSERVTLPLDSISVTPFGVVHASGAPPFALRIAGDGKIVTYSGDTEWTDSLIAAARGADLFIAEAYFFDKAVKFHLDLATLLRHRGELDCRRLIVTHMNEDMLRRRAALDVETAEDGKVVDV